MPTVPARHHQQQHGHVQHDCVRTVFAKWVLLFLSAAHVEPDGVSAVFLEAVQLFQLIVCRNIFLLLYHYYFFLYVKFLYLHVCFFLLFFKTTFLFCMLRVCTNQFLNFLFLFSSTFFIHTMYVVDPASYYYDTLIRN